MAKASSKKGSTVTDTPATTPAVATGAALNPAILFAIAAATAKGETVYLSAVEGHALAQAGLIAPDTSRVDPTDQNKVAVGLTEAGSAFVIEHGGLPAEGSASNDEGLKADDYEIETGIPYKPRRRGVAPDGTPKAPKYPFDRLEVGQSFHIKPTAKVPEPWKSVNAAVSLATKSYDQPELDANGAQMNETVTLKKRGPDGKMIAAGETTRIKMKHTRTFSIVRVDNTDPKGVGARVYRLT